jgi:sortase A
VNTVIAYLRAHRGARRGLSVLSVVLVLVAVGLIGYPFFTDLWGNRVQKRLASQIDQPEIEDRYRARTLRDGDALTDIKIPKLGVDTTVVQGISRSALRAGAGHYPDTPLPCEQGNVAIAGHRTTFGKPFADVDQLKLGDTIILETPVGSCTYQVSRDPFITHPRDTAVIANTPNQRTLTLTTCHPKGSARQRLIVQATLVSGSATSA